MRFVVAVCVLAALVGARSQAARARVVSPGATVTRPSITQLRQLLGSYVDVVLREGKRIRALLVQVRLGTIDVVLPDGRRGTIDRLRIRSVTRLRRSEVAGQFRLGEPIPGRTLLNAGIGLTVGGVVVGAAAGVPLIVLGGREDCTGVIGCLPATLSAGIFVASLSGAALGVGVPLWVAGAVRGQTRAGPGADQKRRRFRRWGMGLTFGGIGLLAVGGVMYGAAWADVAKLNAMRWAGAVTMQVGAFLSLCIGLPMWIEAVRAAKAAKDRKGAAAVSPVAPRIVQALDPEHERRAWPRRFQPDSGGALLSYGWSF
ncbi:MAG: hypothetical protein ABI333_20815 [bacterium]